MNCSGLDLCRAYIYATANYFYYSGLWELGKKILQGRKITQGFLSVLPAGEYLSNTLK
jgi:hypothetical protein